MATTHVTIGNLDTASAVQMALENMYEVARDDSEHERVEAIDSAIALIEAKITKGDFPFMLSVDGAAGDELFNGCEQVEDNPDEYELDAAVLVYVSS